MSSITDPSCSKECSIVTSPTRLASRWTHAIWWTNWLCSSPLHDLGRENRVSRYIYWVGAREGEFFFLLIALLRVSTDIAGGFERVFEVRIKEVAPICIKHAMGHSTSRHSHYWAHFTRFISPTHLQMRAQKYLTVYALIEIHIYVCQLLRTHVR